MTQHLPSGHYDSISSIEILNAFALVQLRLDVPPEPLFLSSILGTKP